VHNVQLPETPEDRILPRLDECDEVEPSSRSSPIDSLNDSSSDIAAIETCEVVVSEQVDNCNEFAYAGGVSQFVNRFSPPVDYNSCLSQ